MIIAECVQEKSVRVSLINLDLKIAPKRYGAWGFLVEGNSLRTAGWELKKIPERMFNRAYCNGQNVGGRKCSRHESWDAKQDYFKYLLCSIMLLVMVNPLEAKAQAVSYRLAGDDRFLTAINDRTL